MKKIFLIGFWPDYDEMAFKAAISSNVDFVIINFKDKRMLRSLAGIVRTKLSLSLALSYAIEKLINENGSSAFFFQAHKRIIPLLLKKQWSFTGGIICRDTVSTRDHLNHYMDRLNKVSIKLWSCDKKDCDRYGMYYYNQFVYMPRQLFATRQSVDVLFVGRDKGRDENLNALARLINNAGKSVLIDLYPSGKFPCPDKPLLSYSQYLDKVAASSCLIEIIQEGQAGITLRPIEAAVHHKKLITDNPSVVSESFYHPNNVLLFDQETSPEMVEVFLAKPFHSLPLTALKPYSAEFVVARMAEQAWSNVDAG